MVYVDGLTDAEMIQDNVIAPLQRRMAGYTAGLETGIDPFHCTLGKTDIFQLFFHSEIDTADLKEETSFDGVINSILKGDTALFLDGYDTVIIISSKKLPVRSIDEAKTEAVDRSDGHELHVLSTASQVWLRA